MDAYKIRWKGQEIGEFIDPIPDMWYLEGAWKSNESDLAIEFERLIRTFQAKEVMISPEKGTRIELRLKEDSNPMHCLVISLGENVLFIRQVVKQDAIDWLLENVD